MVHKTSTTVICFGSRLGILYTEPKRKRNELCFLLELVNWDLKDVSLMFSSIRVFLFYLLVFTSLLFQYRTSLGFDDDKHHIKSLKMIITGFHQTNVAIENVLSFIEDIFIVLYVLRMAKIIKSSAQLSKTCK